MRASRQHKEVISKEAVAIRDSAHARHFKDVISTRDPQPTATTVYTHIAADDLLAAAYHLTAAQITLVGRDVSMCVSVGVALCLGGTNSNVTTVGFHLDTADHMYLNVLVRCG